MSTHRLTRPQRGQGIYHDPLYGNVLLPAVCRRLIDLPTYQRLRRIKQLALIYLGLPGAMHSRFEHSIGVYHLATRAYDVLNTKVKAWVSSSGQKPPCGVQPPELKPEHRLALSLAALLHDIGHGPFSHVFDLFLGACHRRDPSMPRNHEGLSRLIIEGEVKGCEDIPEFLDDVYRTNNKRPIFRPENIASLANGECVSEKAGGRAYAFLSQIITRSWGVDRLDYLRRDALHTGVETGRTDIWNLINSYTLRPPHDPDNEDERVDPDEPHKNWTLALESTAAIWLEAMLGTRDLTFRLICYNDANRIATEMLLRALVDLYENRCRRIIRDKRITEEEKGGKLKGLWQELWACDDHQLLALLGKGGQLAKSIAEKLANRDLYEALPVKLNLSTDLDRRARRQVNRILAGEPVPDSFVDVVIKAEKRATKRLLPQTGKGTVIFDLHLPPLEKGSTYVGKHLYDERQDRFLSLQELCPHLRQIRGVLDPEGTITDGATRLDELYRERMNSLRIYWPYEVAETAAESAKESFKSDGKEPSKVPRPQLRRQIREFLTPRAEAVLHDFLSIIHLEDDMKKSAARARLLDGLQFDAETIAGGLQRRFRREVPTG